jgi:hypothetical protein
LKRLKKFQQFILEQEEAGTSVETDAQAKSRIARSLIKSIFGGDISGAGVDSLIDDTDETKESLPYKGCGRSTPYQMNKLDLPVSFFSGIMKSLHNEDDPDGLHYSRASKDLENGKGIIVGIRNRLETKKREGDAFCDALYFIPEKSKPEDIISPYQITTCPSLAYYGNKPLSSQGTAIKAPGDFLYLLRENELKHGKYKMLIEGEASKFYRYAKGTTKFETYKPGEMKKESIGLLIHRSSKNKGVCVGPWSGGCQVFDELSKFDEFIKKLESQSSNQGSFYYALIEMDSISNEIFDKLAKGEPIVASAEKKSETEEKPIKTKKSKTTPKKDEDGGIISGIKDFFGFS